MRKLFQSIWANRTGLLRFYGQMPVSWLYLAILVVSTVIEVLLNANRYKMTGISLLVLGSTFLLLNTVILYTAGLVQSYAYIYLPGQRKVIKRIMLEAICVLVITVFIGILLGICFPAIIRAFHIAPVDNLFTFVLKLWFFIFLLGVTRVLIHETILFIRQLLLDNEERILYKEYHNFISVLLHDIRAPLKFIVDVSATVGDQWDRMDLNTIRAYHADISKAVTELDTFVNNYMVWLKSFRGEQYTVGPLSFLSLIKNVTARKMYADSPVSFRLLPVNEEEFNLHSDKEILERIINCLLDNAILSTTEKEVTIGLYRENNIVRLQLSYFSDDRHIRNIRNVNELYESDSTDYVSSFHMNHLFIRDLTRAIGGSVAVTVRDDHEVVFDYIIMDHNYHYSE